MRKRWKAGSTICRFEFDHRPKEIPVLTAFPNFSGRSLYSVRGGAAPQIHLAEERCWNRSAALIVDSFRDGIVRAFPPIKKALSKIFGQEVVLQLKVAGSDSWIDEVQRDVGCLPGKQSRPQGTWCFLGGGAGFGVSDQHLLSLQQVRPCRLDA